MPEKINLENQPKRRARIEVPTEVVPLPSLGKVYPVGSPLHGRDRVEIKSMTAHEEDILTSRALLKQGKAFTALIGSCLMDKEIDPEDLLVGDRNALLIAIRITGYGAEYAASSVCPACGESSKVEFDLSKLPVKQLETDPPAPGQNLYSFELPVTKKNVTFSLMTGRTERDLSAENEKKRKLYGPDMIEENVTAELARQIVSLGDETDRDVISMLVKQLPARDSRALARKIDELSPGVELQQSVVCPRCKETSEVAVPMGPDFFWPG